MPDVCIEAFEVWDQRRPLRELAEAFCAAFDRHDAEKVARMIRDEVHAGHRYLVATCEEQTVGFVSWRLWGEPRHRLAELYHIGVTPSCPVRGLGRQLISVMEEHVHAYFRSQGFLGTRKIFILTHAANVAAQNLYKKCGYQLAAVLPEFFREDIDEHLYEKEWPAHRLTELEP